MCSLYLGENLISGSKPINLGVRNIGEIVYSPLPLTDAGLHLLDGSLILGGGIYQGFVDYIADLYTANPSANYFTTEALWQTSVTTYGVCGKFVYDSVNNTVRLPKITGFIEGASGVSTLGNLTEAGLPNITGGITNNNNKGYLRSVALETGTASGALTLQRKGSVDIEGATTGGNSYDFGFDASHSNSIYGNSNTVQPQSVKVLYYIVIATLTKTDIQVDIDEIATDLNGKLDTDGSNAPSKLSDAFMSRFTPDYANGITCSVSLGVEQTYTAPSNGIITYSLSAYAQSEAYLKINEQQVQWAKANNNPDFNSITGSILVSKNDIIKYFSAYNLSVYNTQNIIFYPMKGAN